MMTRRDNAPNGRPTIDLDDVITWPRDAVQSLLAARQILLEYDEAVRAHLRAGGGSSDYPTCTRRHSLMLDLDRASAQCEIIGYHCTRLTDGEIADVRRKGLQPLNQDLVTRRLRAATDHRELTVDLAQRLNAHNYVDDTSCGQRLGMISMIFSKYALQDEGLRDFFTYWGGEAVYEAQPDSVRRVLLGVGRACIVEIVVPVTWLALKPVGKALLAQYQRIERVMLQHPDAGFQDSVTEAIPPSRVRRIITESEPEFESLTLRSTWDAS